MSQNGHTQRVTPTEAVAASALAGADAGRAERITHTILASARHELRSPLQALLGFTELLEAGTYGALSAPQLAFLEHMRTAGKELAHTVDVCAELAAALAGSAAARTGALPATSPSASSLRDGIAGALAEPLPNANAHVQLVEPLFEGTVLVEQAVLVRSLAHALGVVAQKSLAKLTLTSQAVDERAAQLTLRSDRLADTDGPLATIDDLLALGKASRALLLLKLADVSLAAAGGSLRASPSQRQLVIVLPR